MMFMYVSSWAEHGGAPGLSVYQFHENTGKIEFQQQIDAENSLNFSCIDRKNNRMYVCNEIVQADWSSPVTGRIFVYDLDPETGKAILRAKAATGCANPAYVSLDPTGQYLLVAHHSTNLATYRHVRRAVDAADTLNTNGETIETRLIPLEADIQIWHLDSEGIPDELVDNIDHAAGLPGGAEAHPHSIVVSPELYPGRWFVAVADKGTGMLEMYTLGEAGTEGNSGKQPGFRLIDSALTDVSGAHPRYLVFHPTKPWIFVNHEATLDGKTMTVSVFQYDADGKLTKIGSWNALEPGHVPDPKRRLEQQGFSITPDGRYLYTVLNSVDLLAAMAVNQNDGTLTEIGNYPVHGIWPRGLNISPDGKIAISTCLVSGEITPWRIQDDGTLVELPQYTVIQKGASNLSFY